MKNLLIFLGIVGILGTLYAYLQKKNDLDQFWAIGQIITTENRTDTLMIDDTISEYDPIQLPHEWQKRSIHWYIKAIEQTVVLQKGNEPNRQTTLTFSTEGKVVKGLDFEDWDKDGYNDLIINYEDGSYRTLRYDIYAKNYIDLGNFDNVHYLAHHVFYETPRTHAAGSFKSTLLHLRNNQIQKIAYIQSEPHPENPNRVATIRIFQGEGKNASLVQTVSEDRVLGYYVAQGMVFDYDEFAQRFWKPNWQTFLHAEK
jgi:hypothetical protein